jgi:hypothetical protein
MCGPSLPTKDGRRRKTYLIAILDDATRVIVHAEFYNVLRIGDRGQEREYP